MSGNRWLTQLASHPVAINSMCSLDHVFVPVSQRIWSARGFDPLSQILSRDCYGAVVSKTNRAFRIVFLYWAAFLLQICHLWQMCPISQCCDEGHKKPHITRPFVVVMRNRSISDKSHTCGHVLWALVALKVRPIPGIWNESFRA